MARTSIFRGGLQEEAYSKSVAGNSNVTLLAGEAQHRVLIFTGVLTGNIEVTIPTAGSEDSGLVWEIHNNTTGNFSLTVKGASGTGVKVFQAGKAVVRYDGTNMVFALPQIVSLSQALDVASVAANTTAEQTFTVQGLETTDLVFVNKPSLSAGLSVANARASAANTLAITFGNHTASPIDPASETYKIVVIRP